MNAEPMYMKIYRDRYMIIDRISKDLEIYLREIVDNLPHIDAVKARAKTPDRFYAKSLKINDGCTTRKYADPLFEIQDQIGGRITVFYLSDVGKVKDLVLKYLRPIEIQEKTPSTESEFGYFGLHFIAKIPDDVIPEVKETYDIPDFFELQVKTLFQHAWSEAHHDLGYKSFRNLNTTEKRKIAFTAAQAWGADTMFEELSQKLCLNDNSIEQDIDSTDRG